MPQVAVDADKYANTRLNIFFPGVVPSLDGQCVSLAKWFMAEMSDVPNPQAARGDARYVGKTLVAQGHATEVPYSERKRGDLICYEYGTYGHIGVVLSGDRTFEENVNWSGVASKIVDGERVYASRIGLLSEAWRHDQHIYRLKTYKEGADMLPATYEQANIYAQTILFRDMPESEFNQFHKGKTTNQLFDSFRIAGERTMRLASIGQACNIVGAVPTYDNLGAKVQALADSQGFVPVSQLFVKKG